MPRRWKSLARVLEAPQVVKAGVGLADDLKALKKVREFSEKSIVDLGLAAKRQGLQQSGVRNLSALFLGFRIPKGTKTSNWARSHSRPSRWPTRRPMRGPAASSMCGFAIWAFSSYRIVRAGGIRTWSRGGKQP